LGAVSPPHRHLGHPAAAHAPRGHRLAGCLRAPPRVRAVADEARAAEVVGHHRHASRGCVVKPVVLLTLLLLAVGACGSGSSTTSAGGSGKVEVKLTDEGCSPFAFVVAPGSTTFHITNEGANAVSEFYVYEGSNVL